jgi:hypothetical protein
MRTRARNITPLLAALLVLGPASPAAASHRPQPFDAVATIAACGGESLTVGFELEPSTREADRRASARAMRRVRGARLLVRVEAAPLYGRTRAADEVDFGKTTSARRFERFAELPAQTYTGVVRYRWVRGSRTVLAGLVRTRKGRAAGRRGRASCSLEVGKPPVDTRPPFILPVPFDSGWRRAPLSVFLYAVDDLSGVALVAWRLDNGPITRGRRLQITTEGSHQLSYIARDAAGNQTRPASVTLRVDAGPPTEPAIASPSGTSTDTTPEIRWAASTDTGSGVKSYVALVRNSTGAIVWSTVVAAGAPTAATVPDALAPGSYTAEVYAFDGAGPQPFSSKDTSSFSIVSATPGAAPSDNDSIADAADNCPFADNENQADADKDGVGDVCDPHTDSDNDTVDDPVDNCPTTSNANQLNTDGDAQGNACDSDDDGDTIPDSAPDNCPLVANAGQGDHDGDGQGDACDSDDDNDGVPDSQDNCPMDTGPGPLGRDANGCPRV